MAHRGKTGSYAGIARQPNRKKSGGPLQRAKTVIPSGVMSRTSLSRPYPFFVKDGKDPRIVDIDGNGYIDCAMGFGPLILGHAPDPVGGGHTGGSRQGWQFAVPHEVEYELAKIFHEAVPCVDKVTFTNVGSEATFHPLKIARAKTGNELYEGCSFLGSGL